MALTLDEAGDKFVELISATPDLRLELIDSATVDGTGEGTGPDGPFAIRGSQLGDKNA
jgi:hypothetical protein